MTQPNYSYATDNHEVEPRLVFENLPPDVQMRIFQLMAAMTGAHQLPEELEQPVVSQAVATPKRFDMEAEFQNMEAQTGLAHLVAASEQTEAAPVIKIEQARINRDRKMALQPPTAENATVEELSRRAWELAS